MKSIRLRGTAPELVVRAALRRLGVDYEVNARGLPGTPDVANRREKFAIFVHGCYWHRHARCVAATTPKTNVLFWKTKFAANVNRDRTKRDALKALGFRVLVIWECQTGSDTLKDTLSQFVGKPFCAEPIRHRRRSRSS